MASLRPYLFFEGSCEEALNFYAKALGGEIKELLRVKDFASEAPTAQPEKIMHAKFAFWGGEIYASDNVDGSTCNWQDQNIFVCVDADTPEQGRKAFQAMSEGGEIVSAFAKQFWGDFFGSLIDKYKIRWMFNATE
ncbi:MAG: VOC family protein [Salinispira sp.]